MFSTSLSFYHPFFTGVLHRGSTWWFVKDSFHSSIVPQDFSRSYDPPSYTQKLNMVLNTCFVLRSSSISSSYIQVQFFLPYLLRWCYVIMDNFPSSFMIHKVFKSDVFKSIILSSFKRSFQQFYLFVVVILGHISPKAFPKECCYCCAYQ